MVYRTAALLIGSVLLWQNGSASSPPASVVQREAPGTNVLGVRRLGDRLDDLDKSDAICAAALPEEIGAPAGVTRITFYYSVESKETVSNEIVQEVDRMLYYAIGDSVLWCTQENGDDRRLSVKRERSEVTKFTEEHRRLSAAEARRLGIISFNSAPSDILLESEPCTHNTDSENCVIVEGKVALRAHQTDTLHIIEASILDAIQTAMDDDALIAKEPCSAQICSIEKVRWLGTSIEQARAGGPLVTGSDTDDATDSLDEDGDENDDDDEGVPIVAYAAIPLAFIMAMAYMLAKKKRRMLTADQLGLDQDYLRVGTGDPPRHFHEGMYHYTRSGASYLSTNCPTCEETRRLGFCADADLPTIAEGRLYGRPANGSRDESEGTHDNSTHRKLNLINPNERDLAGKHSSIDVHQCTSATCRICNYQPRDVAFVTSPRAALSPISSAV